MHQVNKDRSVLEKAILDAAKSMSAVLSTTSLNEERVEDFLAAWCRLVDFYKRNIETVIAVEVVREYLDWLMLFSTIWHDGKESAQCRHIAHEAVEQMEIYMQEIIKAVEAHLYPTGH